MGPFPQGGLRAVGHRGAKERGNASGKDALLPPTPHGRLLTRLPAQWSSLTSPRNRAPKRAPGALSPAPVPCLANHSSSAQATPPSRGSSGFPLFFLLLRASSGRSEYCRSGERGSPRSLRFPQLAAEGADAPAAHVPPHPHPHKPQTQARALPRSPPQLCQACKDPDFTGVIPCVLNVSEERHKPRHCFLWPRNPILRS